MRVIRIFLMASPPALACSSFDKLVYITFQTYAYGTATGGLQNFQVSSEDQDTLIQHTDNYFPYHQHA